MTLEHHQPEFVYPSPERRLSCTRQSDPELVKIEPEDPSSLLVGLGIMSQSPQHLSPPGCGGSPQEPQSDDVRQFPPQQHGFAPSQEQSQSYPSPEPLGYYGSPLQSQIVGRSQTWEAPAAVSWSGEAPSNYSFETPESSRSLPMGSYRHGVSAAHMWEQPQGQTSSPRQQQHHHVEYSQGHYESRSPLFAPQRYPSLPGDNIPCYSQLGIQTATPHPENTFSFGGSHFVGRSYPPESYTSAPSQRQPLEVVTSFPSSAYTINSDAELSTPMTPVSDMDEDILPGCSYEEDDDMRRSGSPRVMDNTVEGSTTEQGAAGGSSSARPADTPYAKLIFQAFMSSPRRALTLQEIYQWFRDNTDKAETSDGKGWQNSIRHNLSMNGAFVRRQIPADGGNEGEEDSAASPSGKGKGATEWVLCDWAVKKGHVESTTRYRNQARRNGGKKSSSSPRAKAKAAQSSPYRTARRRMTPRDMANPYAIPSQMSYTSMAHADPRTATATRYYNSPYATPYDLSAAEQLQRLSIAPAQRYMEQRSPYEFYHPNPTSMAGGPLELQVHHGYHPAPMSYSSELFLAPSSVPGSAPTVASEDDINEVITPEASYAVMEPPRGLLCGEHHSPATGGPTSQPYSHQPPSAYYRHADGLPSYSMSDVAGVCDDGMMRSCWDEEETAQH